MKTRDLFLFLIGILTISFLPKISQAQNCGTYPPVKSTWWGTPGDQAYAFSEDSINLYDTDTAIIYQGTNSEVDFQYLMPKKFDASSQSGGVVGVVDVIQIDVNSVSGLPAGLSWDLNQAGATAGNSYNPQTNRFGAVRVCGTTFANPNVYQINVSINATVSTPVGNQSGGQSIPIYIKVLAPAGGNPYFTFSQGSGCDSVNVNFEAIVPSPNTLINPIEYSWDFTNDGSIDQTGKNVSHNYTTLGANEVKLDYSIYEYYISGIQMTAPEGCYCDISLPLLGCTDQGEPYLGINTGNGDVYLPAGSGTSASWSNINIPIKSNSIVVQFWEEDNGRGASINGDDLLGTQVESITSPLSIGQVITISNGSCGTATLTIARQVLSTNNFIDTINVYPSSNTPTITNTTGSDTICAGDSVVLSSSSAASYVWKDASGNILSSNQTYTTYSSATVFLSVTDLNSTCESIPVSYTVVVDTVNAPSITQNASGALEVNNPNGHSIQWLSNGVPIPSATTNTLTDLSSGNPFTVSFTSSTGCTATSAPFTATILQAGTSTQSGNELTPTTPIDFVASGFSMCSGESIAWAVSTQADGAITNMTELQTAINNGWVFPSSSTDSLNLNCGNATFPPGDYFMTPFTAQSYDPNCVPNGKLCMEIEAEDGVGLVTDQLIFTFPDGSTKNIRAIVPANFQSLLPNVIDSALINLLPSVVPGGALCFNLSDLYSGDPNGTWTVSAQNTGTGSVTVTIPTFEVGVYTDSCSAITQNEVSQIPATSETITGGSSGQLSFTINATSHTPPFPTVNANCLLFGSATAFSSTCATSITTIANVENLMVYPNPNNGIFTVEFELDKTEAVAINIIDITGRVVLNREYPNVNGEFKEQFDLKNNLDAGFYVIDINVNGNRTQRKIIVK